MRECENVHTKNLKKEKKLFKDSKKIKVVFPFSLRTFLFSLSGLSRFFIVFCLIDFERQKYIFTCNTILKNYKPIWCLRKVRSLLISGNLINSRILFSSQIIFSLSRVSMNCKINLSLASEKVGILRTNKTNKYFSFCL